MLPIKLDVSPDRTRLTLAVGDGATELTAEGVDRLIRHLAEHRAQMTPVHPAEPPDDPDRLHHGDNLLWRVQAAPRLSAIQFATQHPGLGWTAMWLSRAQAEDILQDTWLKLDKARTGGPIDNPGGYITQVARNALTDQHRKDRRRGEIDDELNEVLWEKQDTVSPERILIGREAVRAVETILAELPERTRQIFLMNRIDGISHRKIASQLGISDEAVYYHIRRALERLA